MRNVNIISGVTVHKVQNITASHPAPVPVVTAVAKCGATLTGAILETVPDTVRKCEVCHAT